MKFTTVLFVSFILTLLSCNEKSTSDEKQERATDKKCDIANLTVPETRSEQKNILLIREPVALTFFNLNKLLAKYDRGNDDYRDSLPEKLRASDRQEIYKTVDIAGMYGAFIEPELDSMSIKIIDTVQTNGYIAFNVGGKRYVINKALYQETDGVLFYNGNDKPVFWTEGVYCESDYIVKEYYKKK